MNTRPVVGMDVSKAFSDLCALGADNSILARLKFQHTVQGLEQAISLIKSIQEQHGDPVIIMESTGHYHRLPCSFLQKAGFEVIVVNPLQSHALRNIDIRKIKTDKNDAYRIAMLYRLNGIKPSNIPTGVIMDLRIICRQYANMSQQHTAYKNKLTGVLDQCFPGYSSLWSHVSGSASKELLYHYPTPSAVLNADINHLNQILMMSRQGETRRAQKLAKLLTLAAQAEPICIPCEGLIISMRSIISMLRIIQTNLKQLFAEIIRISSQDEAVALNRDLLDTIPGISSLGACILISEIGDPKAFRKPTQLVAFFGLEPSEHQSGTFKSSSNKITKRGSPYVRRLLSMAVMSCISEARVTSAYNPALAEYYKRKCATKPTKVAVCAVVHKMVYIIFAVLRDQKPFEFRSAEEHAQRIKQRQKNELIA